ncbi:ATP-binding cassette domain-containing protein [Corallococcus sp. CA047B]|uniref:ATP-binding cassette domain-containing protein n=1 Tax=Corallococcus sp. CA047B TaxID=2316729 RepID=UPI000EA0A185|nr:ATP-binding cassette domain-containing protein [Corallococcus sp. CA047B]RKH08334.1 ATP-binding cassette domain-containing protein [Corallococcus sp. CA047B]
MNDTGPDTLVFEDVAVAFEKGRRVLDGLSAQVSTQELTFIAGASGSGKSVLCRLAVGLLRPEAGVVTLFGERVDTQAERTLVGIRRRAPYLVQGPALLDWRTLRENVRLADPKAPEDAVETALEQVGLKEWADRLPPELGPGAKKRAAIARALVLKPRYLLLDEPTTGLDRRAATQVEAVLASLKEQGLGALVVSHDYRQLREIADRVLVVAKGRCVYLGTPKGFLESPAPELRTLTAPFMEGVTDG